MQERTELRMAVHEGLTLKLKKQVTEEAVRKFAEATGDNNPIHFDHDIAKMAGFPSAIAHGQLVVAMANSLLTDLLPTLVLREQTTTYRRPIPVGATVEIAMKVTRVNGHRLGKKIFLTLTFSHREHTCFESEVIALDMTLSRESEKP